jgi:hypothetical protein
MEYVANIKKLGFTKFVDSLKPAELKKFISNINKYVRGELLIRVSKKTHEDLKKEVKNTWQVLNYDGIAALETKNLKEVDDIVPRKSQNVKKPTESQLLKYGTLEQKKQIEKKIIKSALDTLARNKK